MVEEVTRESVFVASPREGHGPDRGIWEVILVGAVAVITAAIVLGNIYFERKLDRQKSLFFQLQILRSGIQTYKLVHGRYPPSLEALATGTFRFPGEDVGRRYVENLPLEKEGKVADPFKKPYRYDPFRGWVNSDTDGYEFW